MTALKVLKDGQTVGILPGFNELSTLSCQNFVTRFPKILNCLTSRICVKDNWSTSTKKSQRKSSQLPHKQTTKPYGLSKLLPMSGSIEENINMLKDQNKNIVPGTKT